MKPEIVFAMYRPHEGKDSKLREVLAQHMPTLRRLELVTDRDAIMARAKDGTYVEIFEWRNSDSSAQAHEHPEVAKVWEAMAGLCDLVTFSALAEAKERFPHFEPVNL